MEGGDDPQKGDGVLNIPDYYQDSSKCRPINNFGAFNIEEEVGLIFCLVNNATRCFVFMLRVNQWIHHVQKGFSILWDKSKQLYVHISLCLNINTLIISFSVVPWNITIIMVLITKDNKSLVGPSHATTFGDCRCCWWLSSSLYDTVLCHHLWITA